MSFGQQDRGGAQSGQLDRSGCCCCCGSRHRPICPCPEEREGVCSATVIVRTFGQCVDCCPEKRCHRCRRPREINVGALTIDCNPMRFETCGQEKTIASCCVNGFRQPGTLVPLNLPLGIGSVPSNISPSNLFSTAAQPACCRSCCQ